MRTMKLLGACLALSLLAACAAVDVIPKTDLQRAREAQASGGTPFTQALTKEYKDLMVFEADEMKDWRDANFYADRTLRAADGESFGPQDPAERELPEAGLAEVNDIRARLIAALDAGGRTNKPEIAARAQSRFDCWLEQSEENFQFDHISACRDELLAALTELEVKATPGTFLILFDFDKSDINARAQAVVKQILASYHSGATQAVSVTGHTDRSGTDQYNEALSQRRAEAVRAALIAGGIPADLITTAWRGETENAVPTADGVREQANRRAEVIIQ